MTYHYEPGAVRWRRAPDGDPRGYRADKGWGAFAHLLDNHPLTWRQFPKAQWWIREEFKGD